MSDSGLRQGPLRAALTVVVAILLVGLPAKAAAADPPRLDAGAWILLDPSDDSVIAAKAPNRRLPVASATKLMTA
ncbi:MAG: hypothetical protein ACJ75R_06870, partial [Solirubrobacterales bacterium]